MLRHVYLFLTLLVLMATPAVAQDWAVKMFNTTSHDFGTVARGAKAQFRFQVKNIYEEDAHILSVRSSCGCTTPQITKSDLKTFETGEVVAEFNTREFQGHKSATVYVTFDKPFHAEVQLQVTGFIRTDVVLQPGSVDLGTVEMGTPVEKKLQVSYAGRDDWALTDAKTTDEHFEVEFKELTRGGGHVNYELLVRLTADAPAGYVKDQLILVTNDGHARELPVDVQGRVLPAITISPAKLFMGVVQPGKKVTKTLFVRGKKPFKILEVKCADKSFTIEPSQEAKAVHVIPVVFTAGTDPGRVTQKISLLTDQGSSGPQVFTAFAEVVKSDGGNASEGDRAGSTEETPPVTLKIEAGGSGGFDQN